MCWLYGNNVSGITISSFVFEDMEIPLFKWENIKMSCEVGQDGNGCFYSYILKLLSIYFLVSAEL